MANVTVITDNVAGAPAVLADARLTADGHTSVIVDESTITGGAPESGDDLVVCIDNANGNSTLAGHLETLMGTHGVPVMLCWSTHSGTFTQGHLANLLGIIAGTRKDTEDGSDYLFPNSHQAEQVTDCYVQGHSLELATASESMVKQGNSQTGAVGGVLLTDSAGLGTLYAATAGSSRTPSVGGIFDTKVLFAGFLNGTGGWDRDARILFRTSVNWLLDLYDVGFPT